MTLHDRRNPRNATLFTAGVLSLALTFSCTGTIGGNGPGSGSKGGNGSSGSGSGNNPSNPGGTGGPAPGEEILPPGPEGQACQSTEFTPARVWRLSDDQFSTAVKDLLPGVTAPNILTPGRSAQQFIDFAELFEIGPAVASEIRTAATAAANEAVGNVDALLGCQAGQDAKACAEGFVVDFASRAFRRPLEDVESEGLKGLYQEGAAVSQAEGLKMAISAVLQSPSFLYRTELGKAGQVQEGQNVELTTHELASSLSFLFLNSIPDAPLRAAADDGSLTDNPVFQAQVERLMALPRVQEHLTTVLQKWVGLGLGINNDLATQEMDFTAEIKSGLEAEVGMFFADILKNGGTIQDLLTSNKGFVNATTAPLYGVSAPAGDDLKAVTYPASERAGILTLSGILAKYSAGHAVVFRGKYVRDELLCGEIPPPPNDPIIEEETKASENLPEREQVERRLQHGTCGGCHTFMDPLGLAFMNYDALGRFHTEEDGQTIDSSGELMGAGSVDGPVKNALDLADKLSKSEVARGCITQKMFGYALGRLTEKFDSCEMQKIDNYLSTKGGKLSDLMAAIVYSSAFRYRTGGK